MKHVIAYEGKCNVALGVMQEAYVPHMVEWINRYSDIEGTLQRPPYAPASGIEWLRKLPAEKGTHEVFAVLERTRKTYRYVGHMGLHRVEWPNGIASSGSMIGAKNARGRGLGTEAKLLLLYHAFMIMGLRKLTSSVKDFNVQSAGHLLKCGYAYAGRHRRHHLHRGKFVDLLLFEVFREQWEPIWEKYVATRALPKLSPQQRAFLTKEMRP